MRWRHFLWLLPGLLGSCLNWSGLGGPACQTVVDTPQVSTLSWKPDWEFTSVDINQNGDFFFSPRTDIYSDVRWDALIRINREGKQTEIRTGPEVKKPETYVSVGLSPPPPTGSPGYVAVFGSRIWLNAFENGTYYNYRSHRQLRMLETAGLWVHEEVWLEDLNILGTPIFSAPNGEIIHFGSKCTILKILGPKKFEEIFSGSGEPFTCPRDTLRFTADANGYFYSIPDYTRPASIPAEDWPPMSTEPPDMAAHDDWVSSRHEIYRLHNNSFERWAGMTEAGFKDGLKEQARFNNPEYLTAARDGTLYVADTGNHAIRKVSPTGEVTTLAGDGSPGSEDGPADQARFDHPRQILLGPCHRLYVFDSKGVREIALPPGPASERWGPPVSADGEQS